jgi:ankyrin repeat protein
MPSLKKTRKTASLNNKYLDTKKRRQQQIKSQRSQKMRLYSKDEEDDEIIQEFVQNPNNAFLYDIMQMIDNKVDIDVQDPTYSDYTALMYNVEHSKYMFVSNLLDLGADPNIKDINNETALFKTLNIKKQTDAPLFISLLLKYGAKQNIKNKKGLTAYDVALNKGYVSDDLTALLLNPKRHIKPEFIDEILNQTYYEKDLYEYLLSSSSPDESSPKLRYQESLNEFRTVYSSGNNLFKMHIENPKEIFENYRNLSHPKNNIDCAYQSLFALGLIGRNSAKKGSKIANLVKKHYSDKRIGVSLDSIKDHIISIFDLKQDDIIIKSIVPKSLALQNFYLFLDKYLNNNTCTIIFIEFAHNDKGHFCIAFEQDNELYIFDPQFTGQTKILNPVFPLMQLNNFYSKTHEEPVELTEYSVFMFQNSVPLKTIRADYCSHNLPLFVY